MKKLFAMAIALISLIFIFTSCQGLDDYFNKHKCDFSNWITITEPKCEEKGLIQRFCTICSYTETKYIDALGHDEISYEAQHGNCGVTGWNEYVTCSRCGYSTYNPILPSGNHSYNSENVCEVCGDCKDKGLAFILSADGQSYLIGKYTGNASNVIIPSKYKEKAVTGIEHNAFENCTTITSITIPKTITIIESNAFKNCPNLNSVYASSISSWCNISFMPNEEYVSDWDSSYGLGYARIDSNPMCYAKELYINGQLLVDLVIPSDIVNIPHFAFYSCESIKSVTFHEEIISVGSSAFYDSKNISSLYITDIASFFSIDFYEYPAMAALYSVSNPMKYASNIYLNGKPVVDLVITDGVTYITQHSFANCTSLKSVYIPNSVKAIGYGAFENATNLTSVVFKNVTGWETIGFDWEIHEVSSIDLANPQTAVYLLNTEYKLHDWERR